MKKIITLRDLEMETGSNSIRAEVSDSGYVYIWDHMISGPKNEMELIMLTPGEARQLVEELKEVL